MPKYVIVGGSAAGIGAVEAIREVDPIGTISVISEESFSLYSRPMISNYVSGRVSLDGIKYRDSKFWKNNKVQALTGRKAASLNFTERYVKLDGGAKIYYEKLLIATGGKPILPRIEGVNKDGIFTFTSFADADRLMAKIRRGQKVVVVGGGLIGVAVAEALVQRGLNVTIVELKDRILNLILDETASEIVENVIRKVGVTILTGQSVQRILGKATDNDSIVGGVLLTNGNEIQCDLVVFAIGVIPRTELVIGTDVKMNRGIIVDKFMRTNVSDVFACGDVAEVYDFLLDENRLLPLWPIAYQGGKVAGYNMAGKEADYLDGTFMSSLNYFDLPIISVGIVNPPEDNGYEVLINHDASKNVYKKLVLRDDVIVGMIFVNGIERAGILFNLMKNHVNVKKFKKQLISENPNLAIIPLRLRKKLFMGV